MALWASPRHQLAIIWATTTLIFTLYHGIKNRHSADREPSYVSRSTITRTTRNALFFGSLWSMLPLLFFSNATPGEQVIIACLCAGVLGGGTFVLASVPAAAIAFTAPIVVASAIAILRSADPKFLVVAVLMISYVAALWRAVCVYASQIAKRVAEQVQVETRVRRDELTSPKLACQTDWHFLRDLRVPLLNSIVSTSDLQYSTLTSMILRASMIVLVMQLVISCWCKSVGG